MTIKNPQRVELVQEGSPTVLLDFIDGLIGQGNHVENIIQLNKTTWIVLFHPL